MVNSSIQRLRIPFLAPPLPLTEPIDFLFFERIVVNPFEEFTHLNDHIDAMRGPVSRSGNHPRASDRNHARPCRHDLFDESGGDSPSHPLREVT